MSKKDKMLNLIMNNTNVFMKADNYDVIPYTKLSSETFNQAKKSFANTACYGDVVCLISTSIWKEGKSGILFTTQGLYAKSWGVFTTSYYYDYSEYYLASFNGTLDIDINNNEIIELMEYLEEIREESESERIDTEIDTDFIDTAFKLGGAAIVAAGLTYGAIEELRNTLKNYEIEEGDYDIADNLAEVLQDLEDYFD